eukprot:TRINITY_DN4787_c0_g1_i2.p2 TRINITY_DN4787_c0_g1~~TRINITY_DN4787_c0_g1_i2.p2  ORF type:complete len:174 (-),score=19.88 TRINITY_DN4787_c0_g1_i2:103-624(-)
MCIRDRYQRRVHGEAVEEMDGYKYEGRRLIVQFAGQKKQVSRGRGPQSDDVCYNCQGKGHWANECRRSPRPMKKRGGRRSRSRSSDRYDSGSRSRSSSSSSRSRSRGKDKKSKKSSRRKNKSYSKRRSVSSRSEKSKGSRSPSPSEDKKKKSKKRSESRGKASATPEKRSSKD